MGALDENMMSRRKDQVKIIGALSQLESIVKKYRVEEIIQADPQLKEEDTRDLHAFCRNRQIKLKRWLYMG